MLVKPFFIKKVRLKKPTNLRLDIRSQMPNRLYYLLTFKVSLKRRSALIDNVLNYLCVRLYEYKDILDPTSRWWLLFK